MCEIHLLVCEDIHSHSYLFLELRGTCWSYAPIGEVNGKMVMVLMPPSWDGRLIRTHPRSTFIQDGATGSNRVPAEMSDKQHHTKVVKDISSISDTWWQRWFLPPLVETRDVWKLHKSFSLVLLTLDLLCSSNADWPTEAQKRSHSFTQVIATHDHRS